MIRNVLLLVLVIIFLNKPAMTEIKVLVFVDDQIITNYDLKNELNYLEILNSKLKEVSDIQKFELAKQSLINQIIKEKEIKKFAPNMNFDLFVDDYLKDLFLKLNLSNQQEFEDILSKKTNYLLSDVKKKIEIDLAWNEMIYRKYNSQVKIDESKIIKEINNIERLNKEYLLSEIIFTKKKNINIRDLLEEIKLSIEEIGFNNTANIYSIADSAKFGGKVGWISDIALPKNINDKIKSINPGEYTDVIELSNNFIILKLEDEKIIETKINKNDELKKLIAIKTNEQLSRFSKIYFNKAKLNYSINEN